MPMSLFIFSFRRVLGRRWRRTHYLVIGAALLLTLIASTVAADQWLRSRASGKLAEVRRLKSANLLLVGSSQLNGMTREELGLNAVNLSHQGNGLRMITETIRSALRRGERIEVVVFELGDVVVGSDPTRLRDHTFFEMGVSPWQFPGSLSDRAQAAVTQFPLLRIPRLAPELLVMRLRPELNAAARGLEIQREANFVNNAAFRIDDIRTTNSNQEQVADNLNALHELCELLKQKDLSAIALITPIDESLRSLRSVDEDALIQSQCSKVSDYPTIRLLNLFDSDAEGFSRSMFEDSNHLNAKGRSELGRRIREALQTMEEA